MVLADGVAVTLNEEFSTAGTIGFFAVGAVHIAQVDKPEPPFMGDFAGAQEGIGRRGWKVLELVLWKETRKVQRCVDSQVVDHPAAKLFGFLFGIVERRDDQVGNLEHDAGFLHDRAGG